MTKNILPRNSLIHISRKGRKVYRQEYDEDGRVVEHEAYLLPLSKIHLHVEQFSQNIYWTFAEDLRLLRGKENLHITRYNRRKTIKKTKKMSGWYLWSWEGAVKGESFLHPGKPLHQWEDWPGQKKSLRGEYRNWFTEPDWRENCTDGQCCSPALPSLRLMSTIAAKFWVLGLRIWRSDTRRGLGLDGQKHQGRAGIWCDCNWGCTWRKPRLSNRSGAIVWVGVHEGRGGTCHCSLCPCPSVHRRQDIFCTGLRGYPELAPFTWTPGGLYTCQHVCISSTYMHLAQEYPDI